MLQNFDQSLGQQQSIIPPVRSQIEGRNLIALSTLGGEQAIIPGLRISTVAPRVEIASRRFRMLANSWRSDVEHLSSTTEIALHPAYQQIIGMGKVAVPFILEELERRPGHWFWALKAITGVDPVAPDQRGRRTEMARAWLQWGREQGLQWR